MKGKSGQAARGRGERSRSGAESLALSAFNRLIAEPSRLAGFLSVTGLRPDTIREAAASPEFLSAVLDYVSSDEQLILAVAGELEVGPDELAAATAILSPRAEHDP